MLSHALFPYITTLLFISVLYSVFKVRRVFCGTSFLEATWKTGTQALGAFRWFSSGLRKFVRGEVERPKAVHQHAEDAKQSIAQILVGSSGLEPPTSRLSGARSNHLSYEPIVSPGAPESRRLFGEEEEQRSE